MDKSILIVGYGNIGKHIYGEFKTLNPNIYDTGIPRYKRKEDKHYGYAFICVPTDMREDGSCDTSIVESVVKEINAEIIIIKSTVPPGTTDRLIADTGKKIIFSPEHYGVTQHCKKDSGFVVFGGKKCWCGEVAQLYYQVKNGYYKFYYSEAKVAELAKYMLNSFLALKVTFCCEFYDISKNLGVSYEELRELFVADERVGNSHTFVYEDKPYYDSHCFNKDVPALVKFSEDNSPLIKYMLELNSKRKGKHI